MLWCWAFVLRRCQWIDIILTRLSLFVCVMGVQPLMEHAPAENCHPSTLSTSDIDHHLEDGIPQLSNHEDTEPKSDITFEELRSIMEVIAATGKFWHDWDMLKCWLSYRLKQVLAEYPEAQVFSDDGPQPSSLSGDTYPELVRRLDEALLTFIEGPPFTLQRLCEILLTPKSTYRSLSKLALALERNLLVTSTLTICTDPYPRPVSPKSAEPDTIIEESASVVNGDVDEEMVEAESDEAASIAEPDNKVNDAQIADTEVNDAQIAEADATEAQPANTELNDAQIVETEVGDAQIAEAEGNEVKDVDTEMREEKTSEAVGSNPETSSDSVPVIEPRTVTEQNPATTQEP